MNARVKYLIKNIGILTISNFSMKILTFLMVPLYTSILTTEEYGMYDIMMSTVALLCPIITLNIADAIMRFAMDKKYDKKQVATIGFKQILDSIIIFVFACIFGGALFESKIRDLVPYLLIYYVFYIFVQYFAQLAKGMEKIATMSFTGILGTLTMIVANLIFLVKLEMGLKGFLIGNILSLSIQVVCYAVNLKIWKMLQWKINKDLKKEMLLYSTPLIITSVGWWVNNASDRYIVTFLCGMSANGILSVAYKIPQIINIFRGIFMQAWQVSAIKEYGTDDTSIFYGDIFQIINLVMCIMCMALILMSKPLAFFLYAKDFYSAWRYVPFLLISCVLNFASDFLGFVLAVQKKTKILAFSGALGAITNIVLNMVLIYAIGIQGATIATMISNTIIFLINKWAVDNEVKVDGYGRVACSWIILCLQACIEIYTEYWFLEILIVFIFFFINRNIILKKIVKSIIRISGCI